MKRTATSKRISKSAYTDFVNKAEEFLYIAKLALEKEKYNSAGLNAVHATISACDAILAKEGGIRSTAKDHTNSADLLKTVISCKTLTNQINRYKKILKTKNLVAYEQRGFFGKEAAEIVSQADRFFSWAMEYLS